MGAQKTDRYQSRRGNNRLSDSSEATRAVPRSGSGSSTADRKSANRSTQIAGYIGKNKPTDSRTVRSSASAQANGVSVSRERSKARIDSARAAENTKTERAARRESERSSSRTGRFIILATNISIILLALTLVGASVYPGLQSWWKIRRDLQLLQAESDALSDRNNKIQALIDALGTAEGIESRAREEFGWVLPGESAVSVNGLDSHGSSTSLPEGVPPGSLRPEIDWVTDTLDFIFGYEYPVPPPAPDDVIIGL